MAKHQIEQQINDFLNNHKNESFSVEELSRKLSLNKSKDFKLFVKAVASLERDKIIVLTKKGKIKLPQLGIVVEGTYRANERGFGFVTIDSEEDDVFISKEKTNFALDGDKVTIDILRPQNILESKGAEGRVVEILERHQTQLVGEFVIYDAVIQQETDLLGELVPKDKKLSSYRIYVASDGLRPVDGSVCILEITHYPEVGYPTSIEGVVKQVVGHKDDPGMDILSVVIEHGIPVEFSDESIEQAERVPDHVSEAEIASRRDLRNEVIVTIDGADAKDLDDAVTVRRLSNGNYFLGVHIADVSYYVTENSPLDKEAFERGTSVYLTDRVIPMIPKRLSNGICSLNPKVPRLTMSCEMEIDKDGHVVKYDIFESVIQTTERMTYSDVNLILMENDQETKERYEHLVPMFETMAELHRVLETMREKRGAISFEDHEAYIKVDESGHPDDIVLRERGVGERLIESFMLAANETVATHFETKHLPFIYRIHESPNEEKLQRFFEFVSTLGLLIKGTKSTITPSELQDALDKVKGRPEEGAVNTMLLRSMQQAVYSEGNVGHYGLASKTYTHFTSPIRRYPDLIVHRLIRSYQTLSSLSQMSEKWEVSLPEIAKHSSEMERRAVQAERDTNSLKKAEFMADKVGEVFDGVISSVTKFGFFVELDNTVEGLVHVNSLKQDFFHYVDNRLTLVGEHSGITYRIGDTLKVKVTKANPETREIDFEVELSDDELKMVEERAKRKKSQHHDGRKRGAKKQPGFKTPKGGVSKKGKKPFYKSVNKKKKTKKKGRK